MIFKIGLTVVVVFVWYVLLAANIAAARRTEQSMQLRDNVSAPESQRRTGILVLAWAAVITAVAVVALLLIW